MDWVELGFVKQAKFWKLRSKYFPSKVGGKPAWLTLNKLPEPTEITCKSCGNPFVFLLQVYANIGGDTGDVDTFHRTIFVFMCRNGKCFKRFSNESFIVFRSQLRRKNDFYPFEAPTEMREKTSNEPSAEQYQALCDLCGCKALMTCEKCSKKNYCSDFHKKFDWNYIHKEECGKENDETNGVKRKKMPQNPFLLPEYRIVERCEELPEEEPEKSDVEKMMEYRAFMKSSNAPMDFQNMPLDDLDSVMKKNDKAFNKFRKRIQYDPEQILRYQRGGDPLLVSAENTPAENKIPPCQCGAKRIFEFQIMSKLLYDLKLDTLDESPDWGTLLIYTCSRSCEAGTGAYVKEFLWKQDFSDNQ